LAARHRDKWRHLPHHVHATNSAAPRRSPLSSRSVPRQRSHREPPRRPPTLQSDLYGEDLRAPAPALTESGTLPQGVTWVDNGTAQPPWWCTGSTRWVYKLTITATNTFGTATQAFTLTVDQAPGSPVRRARVRPTDCVQLHVHQHRLPLASVTTPGPYGLDLHEQWERHGDVERHPRTAEPTSVDHGQERFGTTTNPSP